VDLGLEGRVALVTGGSQGIGRATAIQFAREAARVAITYRHHRDKAEDVADTVREAGAEAMVLPFDLAVADSARSVVAAIVERWGRLDVLVNNAVQWEPPRPAPSQGFDDYPLDALRDHLRANVEGTVAMTQAAVAAMRTHHWGRIVSVSSGLAVHGMPGSALYSAAKAALHGLTRSLFTELGPQGILINVVMAGLTLTESASANVPLQALEEAARSSPLRRLAEPEEVAKTIVFLASAANSTVNGEILLASGGGV
jgi:3-oxoacyl-[acyl-carrier protein] reductase